MQAKTIKINSSLGTIYKINNGNRVKNPEITKKTTKKATKEPHHQIKNISPRTPERQWVAQSLTVSLSVKERHTTEERKSKWQEMVACTCAKMTKSGCGDEKQIATKVLQFKIKAMCPTAMIRCQWKIKEKCFSWWSAWNHNGFYNNVWW